MEKEQIHIGNLIKKQVEEQNLSITDFAKKIHCVRENVYYIFNSPSMDINRLEQISKALNYDFIKEIYLKKRGIAIGQSEIIIHIQLSDIQNEQQYLYILSKLKEIVAFLETP
jgi:predicted transcriptional regulator